MIYSIGGAVAIPPGSWTATLCSEDGVNCILLVDEDQDPLLLKVLNGGLYLKPLTPVSEENQ